MVAPVAGVHGPGFASAAEQREHFRTDWHRHNVRRKAAGRPPLAEDEFERLVANDGELSSISGSDSDSEEEAAADARRRRGGSGVRLCFTARGATRRLAGKPSIRCFLKGRHRYA